MISVKNVRKAFGEKQVLNGLDLDIPIGGDTCNYGTKRVW